MNSLDNQNFIIIDSSGNVKNELNQVESIINSLGIINYREGLKRLGNKVNRYISTLYKFSSMLDCKELPPFDEIMDNLQKVKDIVHTIKGTAGNLAVFTVYNSGSKFEMSLKDGTFDQNVYDEFIQNCLSAKEKIRARLHRE